MVVVLMVLLLLLVLAQYSDRQTARHVHAYEYRFVLHKRVSKFIHIAIRFHICVCFVAHSSTHIYGCVFEGGCQSYRFVPTDRPCAVSRFCLYIFDAVTFSYVYVFVCTFVRVLVIDPCTQPPTKRPNVFVRRTFGVLTLIRSRTHQQHICQCVDFLHMAGSVCYDSYRPIGRRRRMASAQSALIRNDARQLEYLGFCWDENDDDAHFADVWLVRSAHSRANTASARRTHQPQHQRHDRWYHLAVNVVLVLDVDDVHS